MVSVKRWRKENYLWQLESHFCRDAQHTKNKIDIYIYKNSTTFEYNYLLKYYFTIDVNYKWIL